MTHQQELTINTHGHGHVQDITEEVAKIVVASRIKAGIAHVFNIGSTASIASIEFEAGLQRDLPTILDKLIPPSRDYGHEQAWHDGNSHSHLQATLLGFSISVPVQHGELHLGTWQQIIHVECDVRARTRSVIVTVTGD